jgi:hypothetical protein
MKVALMLYGQPRFVNRPDVFNSYQKYLFDRYDVDVFGHMWYTRSRPDYGHVSSWASDNGAVPQIPEDAMDIITDQYIPVDLVASGPRTFKPILEVRDFLENRWVGNQFYSMENMSNIMSAMASIDTVCCNLAYYIGLNGNHTGFSDYYDFFVLGRYDAVLDNFPLLTNELKNDKFHLPNGGHFNDLIHFWSDVKYLKWLNSLFGSVYKDIELHRKVELPIPELYKYHSFINHFGEDSLERNPMYAHVIRS